MRREAFLNLKQKWKSHNREFRGRAAPYHRSSQAIQPNVSSVLTARIGSRLGDSRASEKPTKTMEKYVRVSEM